MPRLLHYAEWTVELRAAPSPFAEHPQRLRLTLLSQRLSARNPAGRDTFACRALTTPFIRLRLTTLIHYTLACEHPLEKILLFSLVIE